MGEVRRKYRARGYQVTFSEDYHYRVGEIIQASQL